MTVLTEISRFQYAGNNSILAMYPVPFYFSEAEQLRVVLTGADGIETLLLQGADYAVSGTGTTDDGGILTTVAYDNTHTLTIYRDMPITQPVTFAGNGSFPAATTENALDRLTMLIQQVVRAFGRCFRTSEASPETEEIGGNIAGTLTGYDTTGNLTTFNTEQLVELLGLSNTATGRPIAYWIDTGARAAKTPDFIGQVGVQLDNATVWISSGVVAGNWTQHKHAGIATAEFADGAVTADKIAIGNLFTGILGDSSVTTEKIIDRHVTGGKIADSNITAAKMTVEARRGYIKNSDTKTAGTAGQSLSSSNDWNTRHLTQEDSDEFTLNSVSSNQFTLGPGTYEIQGFITVYGATNHYTRLFNVTENEPVESVTGTIATPVFLAVEFSFLSGRFTVNATSAFTVQNYVSGFGGTAGTAIGGEVPVYAALNLWKVE